MSQIAQYFDIFSTGWNNEWSVNRMVGARTIERRQLLSGKYKDSERWSERELPRWWSAVNFGTRTPSMMGRQLDGVPRARKRRRRLSSSFLDDGASTWSEREQLPRWWSATAYQELIRQRRLSSSLEMVTARVNARCWWDQSATTRYF